ncbi:hypothetical protein CHUAL_008661 [Chamberlinius hualienensis]
MEFTDDFDQWGNGSVTYDATNHTFDVNTSTYPPATPEYEYFRDMSRFWVKRVLYPLIMCVGVLGNSITIVILTRRRMRSSTNHYLTALAISDLFYLIFAFTLSLDHYKIFQTHAYYTYWCYAVMLTDACTNTSVWLTVTFTIERYVAVCHPIKGKVLCTRSRAKKVIACVVIFCFAVVTPTAFEWTVVETVVTDKYNNTVSSFQKGSSLLGENTTYRTIYYWFTTITFILVPLSLLAIFNSFLIRSVHQSKSRRRRMTMRGPKKLDNAHQENRITIMLIAVVIMFLLCQLPTASVLIYTSLKPEFLPGEMNLLLGLGNIFNCLVAINAACNFILYCAFSDRYRRIFLRTFVPCLFRRGSPNHSQTNLTAAFTNICQASDADSGASDRRHSVGDSMQRCRRVTPKNKMKTGVKNGHFNCHPMTTLSGPVINETVNTEVSLAQQTIKPTKVYLLDNGYSSTQDDNGSDTTQETVVSTTDFDGTSHSNELKKTQIGLNQGSGETVNL